MKSSEEKFIKGDVDVQCSSCSGVHWLKKPVDFSGVIIVGDSLIDLDVI